MRFIVLLLISLAIIFGITSCDSLQSPTAKLLGYKVKESNLKFTNLEFTFLVNNPNPLGSQDISCQYQLLINGQKLAGGKSLGLTLPANDSKEIILPMVLEYEKVFHSVQEILNAINSGRDSLNIELQGNFSIPFLNYPIAVPFNAKGVLPLPQLPKIKISNVSISEFSLRNVVINIEGLIYNQNNFPLNLETVDYNFSINNQQVGRGELAKSLNITEKGYKNIDFTLHFKPDLIGKFFQDKNFQYDLSGNLNMGFWKIPFVNKGTLVR